MLRKEYEAVGAKSDAELALLAFIEQSALDRMVEQHNAAAALHGQLMTAQSRLAELEAKYDPQIVESKRQAEIAELKAKVEAGEAARVALAEKEVTKEDKMKLAELS